MTSRVGYVQQALLQLSPGVDIGEPGAAITTELCGSWQHDGPCPLAPHHTAAERQPGLDRLRRLAAISRGSAEPGGGELVVVRTVFAAAGPADESLVRSRIIRALQAGSGAIAPRWRLYECTRSELEPDEVELVRRIATG
jgi:hypothetical protein